LKVSVDIRFALTDPSEIGLNVILCRW